MLILDSNIGEHHRHDLEVIKRNSLTLLKQVNDLLDVARVEAGTQPTVLEFSRRKIVISIYSGKLQLRYNDTVDVSQLLRFTASHFDVIAVDRKIEFALHLPSESVVACLDEDKVQRVLLNLLSNAFKFTPVGRVVSEFGR
jgi:signal transduction histidine kinase